ncbi:hypothetical protein ZIOFF_000355 [Zingiber officinale]|uniref:Uncharacterized protein n=1 Tax=Zingiber officinale TaxID=94328 RepID=A0A8J5I4H2_ZINOF|nr:hypothetical protein ZIOFF_000355 [Zingiber officinale]
MGAGRRFPSSSGRASTRDADPLPTADFPSSSGHCFALLSLVAGHRVVPLCCALDFLVLPDSNQTVIQSVALEPLGLRQVLIFGYFDLGISYQRLRENDWHYCRYGRFGNMMSVAASFYKATLAVITGISTPFNNLAIIYKQQTSGSWNLAKRVSIVSSLRLKLPCCCECWKLWREQIHNPFFINDHRRGSLVVSVDHSPTNSFPLFCTISDLRFPEFSCTYSFRSALGVNVENNRTMKELAAPDTAYKYSCITYPDLGVGEVQTVSNEQKEIKSSLLELTSLVKQMALNSASQVSSFPVQTMRVCGICSSQEHTSELCPNLHQDESMAAISRPQFQQRYDPNSSTYNPGWKDHPNLKYGNSFYQQPPQNQNVQNFQQYQQSNTPNQFQYQQFQPLAVPNQFQHQNQQFQHPNQFQQQSYASFHPQNQHPNFQQQIQNFQQPAQNFQPTQNFQQSIQNWQQPNSSFSSQPRSYSNQSGNNNSNAASTQQQQKMEDMMQQILQQQHLVLQQQQHQQRTDSALQNIERQIGQLASNINQMQAQGSSQLPSQTTPNPKGNVSALTLRSGKTTSELVRNAPGGSNLVSSGSIPVSTNVVQPPDFVQNKLDSTANQLRNFPASSAQTDSAFPGNVGVVQPDYTQPILSDFTQFDGSGKVATAAQDLDSNSQQQGADIHIPLPFPQRKVQQRKNVEEEKAREFQDLVNLFSKVEVNVPLLTMAKQIPKYAKFLKDLCVHKKKLKGNELISMGKNVSALIQPVPKKCEDPGVFTVPCEIGSCVFEDAMLDLGASINVMPKSVFQTLGIDLLANRSPLILGRPFLKTARTKIDVHAGTLSMEFADTVVQFSLFDAMKHPSEDHSILSIDIADELISIDLTFGLESRLEIFEGEECLYDSKVSTESEGNVGAIDVELVGSSSSLEGEYLSIGDCTEEAIPQESHILIEVSPESGKGEYVSVGDCTEGAIPQESLQSVIDAQQPELKPLPEHLNDTSWKLEAENKELNLPILQLG